MLKRLLAIIIMTGLAGAVTAESVLIHSISGKVEVRQPGASWEAADEGMEIPLNTVISTGFGSEAGITMDNAELTIKPLTRMTIQEYVTKGNSTTTRLFLGAGKIRADVRKSSSLINDFQVRSPVATAAVRGTSFTCDVMRLEVMEGIVAYSTSRGRTVNVPAGNRSEAAPGAPPSDPAENRRWETSVSPSTSTGEDDANGDGGADELLRTDPPAPISATLEITIE